jgi:hypothetical protein
VAQPDLVSHIDAESQKLRFQHLPLDASNQSIRLLVKPADAGLAWPDTFVYKIEHLTYKVVLGITPCLTHEQS